jgi:glutaredoxin 3
MIEMIDVVLYTTQTCPFCHQAKQLLVSKGVQFCELSVDRDPELRMEMMQKSGRRTVPQIWVGDEHVGGCDDLWALERSGRLDEMLAASVANSDNG